MSQILIAFGILAVLGGLWAVLRPRALLGFARRVTVNTWLRVIAFVLRAALGTLLILVAPSTVFPLPVQLLGVLVIVSGITVLLLGNQGVQRLLNWVLGLGPGAIVTGGIFGIVFGGLMIYLGL